MLKQFPIWEGRICLFLRTLHAPHLLKNWWTVIHSCKPPELSNWHRTIYSNPHLEEFLERCRFKHLEDHQLTKNPSFLRQKQCNLEPKQNSLLWAHRGGSFLLKTARTTCIVVKRTAAALCFWLVVCSTQKQKWHQLFEFSGERKTARSDRCDVCCPFWNFFQSASTWKSVTCMSFLPEFWVKFRLSEVYDLSRKFCSQCRDLHAYHSALK